MTRRLRRLSSDALGQRVPLVQLGPLVQRLTPSHKVALFTPDALHALRYSPSVSHYKAATELGYRARPIHQTVADTLDWLTEHRARSAACQ